MDIIPLDSVIDDVGTSSPTERPWYDLSSLTDFASSAPSGLPFMDEFRAGASALGKKTLFPLLDLLTGNSTPTSSLGDLYDQRLNEIRGEERARQERSPIASFSGQLGGGALLPLPNIMSEAKGVLPALGNVARAAPLGAGIGGLYGFAGGENGLSNRLESALGSAQTGAILGPAIQLGAEGLQGLSRLLAGSKNSIDQSLVGYNPAKEKAPAGLIDDAGNVTKSLSDATEQVSKKDLQFKDLKDLGFIDSIKVSDGPKTVSLNLARFRDSAGKEVGSIIDDASKSEQKLFLSQGPADNQAYLTKTSPDFSIAEESALGIADVDKALGRRLVRKIDYIKDAWEKSDQSLGAFQNIKSKFGKLTKGSYSPTQLKLEDDLNKQIFSALAESLNERIATIRPDLAAPFKKASKAYAASSTFKNSAFQASRQSISSKIGKDLFGFSGPGLGLTTAAFVGHAIPGVGPILALDRAARIAKDIAPVQASKILGALGSVAKTAGIAAPGVLPGVLSTKKQKQESLPKVIPLDDVEMDEAPSPIQVTPTPAVPEKLVKAVIKQESRGKRQAVSNKGARGLMQIMPETAKEIAKDLGVSKYDIHDEQTNIKFGTHYLNKLLKSFDGDVQLALAAYNAGPTTVRNWIRLYGEDWSSIKKALARKHSFSETRNYVDKVMDSYA